jgi:hypothetical protein
LLYIDSCRVELPQERREEKRREEEEQLKEKRRKRREEREENVEVARDGAGHDTEQK